MDLARNYRLLKDLMEHAPDVIYFKDKSGRLIMVNQAHAKGLGLKPQDVIGKTDFDIHPKKKAQKMAKDDLRVMKTGKAIIDKVERGTRSDGVDNYVTTTKIPRYDSKGNIIGLIGITRDITHRMQVENLKKDKARVEKKLESAEEMNSLKSKFVSVVSHELRSPLVIIKDAVEIVLSGMIGALNKKQKKILNMAVSSSRRLNGIIEELLDLSRIESGKISLHYSLVDLNELIKEEIELFKHLADKKGIKLRASLPKDCTNTFVDADRIRQVLINLVNNAMKFTDKGGNIRLEAKVSGEIVKIGVIDSGIGISKEDLPKLFDKFVQVSRIKEADKKGIGLGLSIAKELVAYHSGQIWAESKLGSGSRFYFNLPGFYTTGAIKKEARERINNLLAENTPSYLVDISFINYRAFKKSIKAVPTHMLKDLEKIIDSTLDAYHRLNGQKPQIILENRKSGNYSLLLAEATEDKAQALCNSLKKGIEEYFNGLNIKDVFVNIGRLSYLLGAQPLTTRRLLDSLHIKKVFIGSNARRFVRIPYKADIEISLPEDKKEISRTIDISEGGTCFITGNRFDIDATTKVGLKIPRVKKLLYLKARTAWTKNIDSLSQKRSPEKYKVGLEFLSLTAKEKKALAGFIKSIQ